MKRKWNKSSAATVTVLGVIALIMRLMLYFTGVDEKGLLKSFHPCTIGIWLICALAVAVVLAALWKHPKDSVPAFTASLPAAVGTCAMGAVLLVTALAGGKTNQLLDKIALVLGIVSGFSLIPAALCRWQGKRTPFWLYGLACICFAVRAISCYQTWCGDPQLQNYFFDMMAILLLMLFAYQLTAFSVGMGDCRILLGAGTLASFCCMAALAHSGAVLTMVGGLAWTLTETYSLMPGSIEKE